MTFAPARLQTWLRDRPEVKMELNFSRGGFQGGEGVPSGEAWCAELEELRCTLAPYGSCRDAPFLLWQVR